MSVLAKLSSCIKSYSMSSKRLSLKRALLTYMLVMHLVRANVSARYESMMFAQGQFISPVA